MVELPNNFGRSKGSYSERVEQEEVQATTGSQNAAAAKDCTQVVQNSLILLAYVGVMSNPYAKQPVGHDFD